MYLIKAYLPVIFLIALFHALTQALCISNIRYRTVSISYTLGKCISTFVISFVFTAYITMRLNI